MTSLLLLFISILFQLPFGFDVEIQFVEYKMQFQLNHRNITFGRYGAFGGYNGNKSFIIGGREHREYVHSVIEYDASMNTFTEHKGIPQSTYNVRVWTQSYATLGTSVYVCNFNDNVLYIYNMETNTFTRKSTQNTKYYDRRSCFCSNPNTNSIYISGGYHDEYRLIVYHPTQDEFDSLDPMPLGRREHSCAMDINGIMYLFGGQSNQDGKWIYYTKIYKYNTAISSSKWEETADMQRVILDSTAIHIMDFIVVVGGYDKDLKNLKDIIIYHPESNTVRVKKNALHKDRYGHVVTTDGATHIYVFGGGYASESFEIGTIITETDNTNDPDTLAVTGTDIADDDKKQQSIKKEIMEKQPNDEEEEEEDDIQQNGNDEKTTKDKRTWYDGNMMKITVSCGVFILTIVIYIYGGNQQNVQRMNEINNVDDDNMENMNDNMNRNEMDHKMEDNDNDDEKLYHSAEHERKHNDGELCVAQRNIAQNVMDTLIGENPMDDVMDEYEWIANALKQCDDKDWETYLYNFKMEKVTDKDLIFLLNEDINREGWTSLIPQLGIRLRFRALLEGNKN